MEPNNMLAIEIVYASLTQQKLIKLTVEQGCTIEEAIIASGILIDFPEISLNTHKIGVFSKRRALTDLVNDGERIEIYRALVIDPKEARRAKAKKIKK